MAPWSAPGAFRAVWTGRRRLGRGLGYQARPGWRWRLRRPPAGTAGRIPGAGLQGAQRSQPVLKRPGTGPVPAWGLGREEHRAPLRDGPRARPPARLAPWRPVSPLTGLALEKPPHRSGPQCPPGKEPPEKGFPHGDVAGPRGQHAWPGRGPHRNHGLRVRAA